MRYVRKNKLLLVALTNDEALTRATLRVCVNVCAFVDCLMGILHPPEQNEQLITEKVVILSNR